MLFAISKTKELPANCNLRKIHQQFGQRIHRRTAHRQTAKRFCRTVRKWFSKNQKIHIHQNFTAIFSKSPSDFHTNLQGYTYLSVSFNK